MICFTVIPDTVKADSMAMSNRSENSGKKSLLLLDCAIEITPIIRHIGVVLSFMGSLSLGCYHFDLLMILKAMLMFLLL